MRYEGTVYRPPGEWKSYLLQVTVGCSHNACTFCGMYKDKRYRVRPLEEIFEDIALDRAAYGDVKRVFLCDGDAVAMDTEELLAVLRETAARLGRNPSKKEVFCVYRVFLIQRFGNWPRALTAAGLKRPREQRRADNRRRNEEALRRRKAQELSGQAAAKEAGLTTKTEGEA